MQLTPSLADHPLLGVALALTVLILVGNLAALGYWARSEAAARDGSVVWTFVALVAPPDPVTQVATLPPLFAGSFVVAYLFVTRRSVGLGGERAAP